MKSLVLAFLFLSLLTFEIRMVNVIDDCTKFQAIRLNLSQNFQLSSKMTFFNFSKKVNSFKILGDIECSNFTYFSPIGNSTNPFTGSLDGLNFAIKNIFITNTSSDGVGIFGFGNGCVVKNLVLMNISINSFHQKSALLFGDLNNGNITNIKINTSHFAVSNIVYGNSTAYVKKFFYFLW